MAFAILGSPKPQFFDSSGAPLAGGTLSVLDPADDTNKASYATYDEAEVPENPNSNPITLDSRGECDLWGLDGEDYKLTLKDSAGATVWTTDDVFLPLASAESIGKKLYAQTAAEIAAGVTPTNYQYEPGDVRRYGADPAASAATNTTAIQAAIDANYEIHIPAGTYPITTINLRVNGCRIIGDGWNNTILTNSTDAPMISKSAETVDTPFVYLEGFRMNNTNTAATEYMIDIQITSPAAGPRYSSLKDIFLVGNYGFRSDNFNSTDFTKCRFVCKESLFHISDATNHLQFNDCVFNGVGTGSVETYSAQILGTPTEITNIAFRSCTFEDSQNPIYAYNIMGLSVRDCYWEPDSSAVYLARVENCPSALFEGGYVRMGTSTTHFIDVITNSANALLDAGKATIKNITFRNTTASMVVYKNVGAGAKGGTVLSQNTADSAMPVNFSELFKFKTADQSISSDTTVNLDDDMQAYRLAPNTHYKMTGLVKFDGAAAAANDFKFTFSTSTTNVSDDLMWTSVNEDGTTEIGRGAITAEHVVDTIANKTHVVELNGFVLTHATDTPDVSFKWAQNAASGSNLTVHKGSWIKFERLQ